MERRTEEQKGRIMEMSKFGRTEGWKDGRTENPKDGRTEGLTNLTSRPPSG